MNNNDNFSKVKNGRPTLEGAGVHLHRIFGAEDVPDFDPFLLFDDFSSELPENYERGFPWHPHRGIETITYVLQGEVEHGDSLGNSGVIGPGDVQWMTAGSGIIHQEMPRGDRNGRMYGFQLWANLPAKHKMTEPKYRDIKARDIPSIHDGSGAEVRVICGEYDGIAGPVEGIEIDPLYYDVTVPPGTELTLEVPENCTVFCYVFSGCGDINSQQVCGRSCVLLKNTESVTVRRGEKNDLRLLFIAGRPLNEPVAWGGPIVMNTKEELRQAFQEYENGSFLRHRRR